MKLKSTPIIVAGIALLTQIAVSAGPLTTLRTVAEAEAIGEEVEAVAIPFSVDRLGIERSLMKKKSIVELKIRRATKSTGDLIEALPSLRTLEIEVARDYLSALNGLANANTVTDLNITFF